MREIRGDVFQGRFHNLLISKNSTFWVPQISRITFQVVLANRLSDDGPRRLMLLEAGSAYAPNLYPPDLANADIVGGPDGHDWGYVGATGIGDRSIRALRGKALGSTASAEISRDPR